MRRAFPSVVLVSPSRDDCIDINRHRLFMARNRAAGVDTAPAINQRPVMQISLPQNVRTTPAMRAGDSPPRGSAASQYVGRRRCVDLHSQQAVRLSYVDLTFLKPGERCSCVGDEIQVTVWADGKGAAERTADQWTTVCHLPSQALAIFYRLCSISVV